MNIFLPITEAILLVITFAVFIIYAYYFITGKEALDKKMKKLHIPFGFNFFVVIIAFLLSIMGIIEYVRFHTEGDYFFSYIDWLWYF